MEQNKEKMIKKGDLPIKDKRLAKVIMALIDGREKILGKTPHPDSTFFLGDTVITLGMTYIQIGDTKFKLPNPKKRRKK